MELKLPQLVYDQMKTYKALYAEELPAIMKKEPAFDDDSYIKHLQTVYVIGDGDSLYAAKAVEYVFRAISGIDYRPVPAFEFTKYTIEGFSAEKAASSLLIGLSASGGSPFVVDAMKKYKDYYPNSHVLSICGKVGGEIEKQATEIFSVQILELGRTPGIRTYAASMVGLLAIACEVAEKRSFKGAYSRGDIIQFLEASSEGIEQTLSETLGQGKEIINLLDDSFIAFVGSGPSHGTALFEAAKFVETSGIYSFGQDLEEWNHVEGFAYPLASMLVIHLNPGAAYRRAETLAISASKLGHKIVVVVPEELEATELGDACVVTYGPYDDLLSPLTQYIPFTLLAAVVAENYGRAMFLTDTQIWSRL